MYIVIYVYMYICIYAYAYIYEYADIYICISHSGWHLAANVQLALHAVQRTPLGPEQRQPPRRKRTSSPGRRAHRARPSGGTAAPAEL